MTDVSTDVPTDTNIKYAISYQRISSTGQIDGHGLERQASAAKKYAREHGYQLLTGEWVDKGLSGYTGANKTVGALGRIMEGVKSGLIPKGTTLLIEQWDRLSREHRKKALRLIEDLLDDGLSIVTLNDGQVWTSETYDDDISLPIRLLLSLEQAFKYSDNLSRRLTSAWENNTAKVLSGERLRSKKCPSWLKVVGTLDDGHFEVIPDKAELVAEIYDRFGRGEGGFAISQDLRRRGIPTLTKAANAWRASNLYGFVKSKAPYGTLELGKGKYNNKKTGQAVEGYFPRIVSEETQRLVEARVENPRGVQAKDLDADGYIEPHKRKTKAMLTSMLMFEDVDQKGVHSADASADASAAQGWLRTQRSLQRGKGHYITQVTRRFVGQQTYVDRRFLEGWNEIYKASLVNTTSDLVQLDVAESAAMEMLESAIHSGSPRMIEAAEVDLEELREAIKAQRKATLMADVVIPRRSTQIEAMEPWVANDVLRGFIDKIYLRKKANPIKKNGSFLWFTVRLKSGVEVDFGDSEVLFMQPTSEDRSEVTDGIAEGALG